VTAKKAMKLGFVGYIEKPISAETFVDEIGAYLSPTPMKILSVDDKAENLYMLEALLRGHGHDVDSASNGIDALHLAERNSYDVIISDILMPRMDGFQLCREIKRQGTDKKGPFHFLHRDLHRSQGRGVRLEPWCRTLSREANRAGRFYSRPR
jgi:CheY-like chemotaxis protein